MPAPCVWSTGNCTCPETYVHGPMAYDLCFSDAEDTRANAVSEAQQKIIILVVLLAMVGFGMKIDIQQITLDRIKKPVLVALFGQLIVNPIVMVCLLVVFPLLPEVRLGALMISVSPGGNWSHYSITRFLNTI